MKTVRSQLSACDARVAELEEDLARAGWGSNAPLLRAELRETRGAQGTLKARLQLAEAELTALQRNTPETELQALRQEAEVRPGSRVQGHGPVQDLLRAGRLIDAVQQYRALTGATLRQAKEAVDALERGEAVMIPPRR